MYKSLCKREIIAYILIFSVIIAGCLLSPSQGIPSGAELVKGVKSA